jgi:hypothetical protein
MNWRIPIFWPYEVHDHAGWLSEIEKRKTQQCFRSNAVPPLWWDFFVSMENIALQLTFKENEGSKNSSQMS